MKKLFHFDAPRERYVCDAAVVWCFDNRFELSFRKFLQRQGVVHWDAIKIAGGTKCLASPDRETDRDFVLNQIRISMRLHQTQRVILMLHSDCAAYGGVEAFNGDADAERANHREELHKAVKLLADEIPGIAVDAYFVDFEGVWALDAGAAAGASA
ncbi:MAG TPA: carbonic anhydrase [Verrucomicrobiae bacterium]|nr:carbonic anhydrase [Verrucomicrobiae bacterium]